MAGKIRAASTLQEAQLLVDLLRAAGIECAIMNEHLQGGVGELPFTQVWPEIWIVDDTERERALAVIAEFERPVTGRGGGACDRCGEDNPPAFEICWKCGHALTRV
jgi:hypothetical protein